MAKSAPKLPVVNAEYKSSAKGVYVSVTVTSTAAAPVETIVIDRWDGTTQLYSPLVTLQGATRYHFDGSGEGGQTYVYRARAANSDATSQYGTSQKVTIIDAPEAPTEATAEAASNDSVKITHTLVTSERAPVHGFYLYRSDFGAAFKQVNKYMSPLGNVSNSPGPDMSVRYRTWPYNNVAGAGRYMSNITGIAYTTPAKPTGFTAAWDTAGNIVGTWTNPSRIAQKVELEHSTDNVDWFPIPPPGSGTKMKHSYPEQGVPHYYRVRNVSPKPSLGSVKYSAWVSAPVVAADQTPQPPVLVSPTYADPTAPVVFTMVHNTVDGSGATSRQVRYRLLGTTDWTTPAAIQDPNPVSLQLPYRAGQVVEWSARTLGQASSTWSKWAAPKRLTLRTKPVTVVTSPAPGAVIKSPNPVVTWTGASSQYQIRLFIGGVQKWSDSGSGSTFRRTLAVNNSVSNYSVSVRTFDGYLWSDWSVARAFSTSFSPPVAPTITVTADSSSLAASVRATKGSGGAAVARLEISRRGPGTDWETVFDSAASGTTYTDPLVPLLGAEYRATAWTAAGGFAHSAAVAASFGRTQYIVINYGEGLANRAFLKTNMDISATESTESESVVLGDRVVGFRAEASTLTLKASGTVPKHHGTPALDWGKIVRAEETHYRDPLGRSFPCLISGVSISNKQSDSTQVDFDVERMGTW